MRNHNYRIENEGLFFAGGVGRLFGHPILLQKMKLLLFFPEFSKFHYYSIFSFCQSAIKF